MQKVKPVTVVSAFYPPELGAASRRIRALVKSLSKSNYRVSVITQQPSYPYGRVYKGYDARKFSSTTGDHQEKVIRVPVYPARGKGLKRAFSILVCSLLLLYGVTKVKNHGVIVINCVPQFLFQFIYLYSKITKRPIISILSDFWTHTIDRDSKSFKKILARNVLEKSLRHICKRSDSVIVLTDGMAEILNNEYKFVKEKLFVSTNMIYKDEIENLLAIKPLSNQKTSQFKLLYFGNISYAYDFGILFNAVQRLRENGHDVRLIIAGDGVLLPKLKLEARKMELTSYIDFKGLISPDQLSEITKHVYAHIIPLKESEAGYAARPARFSYLLATARPILYIGEGYTANEIEQQNWGLSSSFNDLEKLIENISYLITNQPAAHQMGIACRDEAIEKAIDYQEDNIIKIFDKFSI